MVLASQYAQIGDMIRLTVQFIDPLTNLPVNLAGGTGILIKLLYPDDTATDFDADLLTDGTDGVIYYDTARDDLSQSGTYFIQGEATVGGQTFSTRNNQQIQNALQVFMNVDNA